MAVSFVGSNATNYQAPPITCAFSPNVTSGNLLIAAVQDNGIGTLGISDTQSNNWTAIISQQNVGGTLEVKAWFAIAGSSGANTVTVTSGSSLICLVVAEYSAADTLDQKTSGTPTGTSFTTNAITTTNANEVIILFFRSIGGTGSINAPFTTRQSPTFTGTAFSFFGDNIVSSIQTGFTGSGVMVTEADYIMFSFYKFVASTNKNLLMLMGSGT